MSVLKSPVVLPVAVGLLLVAVPYSVSMTVQCIYGWPNKPGYKKYIEALKPRRIYCMTKAVLERLRYLQYGRLYFQLKSWYETDENKKHYEKGITFGRRGQKLDLYFPPNVSRLNDGPPPLVVFIYGGAWGSGERSIYCLLARQMSEELSAAVVCPDYCTYPQGNVLGMVQDIADCLVWARESGAKFNFDKDKIVLIGHSAGAHLCALTALFLADEREELLVEAGVQREVAESVRGVIGLSGVYNILEHYEHERKRAVEYVSTMHKAMNGVENFPYYSPTHVLKEVGQDKLSRLPPFALLHGSSDFVVPVQSSCKFSALLSGLDVKVSLYLLPGLNHMDIVTDLMSADRRYYHPIYSCIKLEWRKLNLLHP
ncbi:probable isoprenylcysteine alpha-carbonyl methylesterase ICMEL1 [Takifugu rubripes]|uniref:probable isoprenylcysteine alpha-carbonyl methylesterase ICMEL1 n=1 Tax=Takifugu rubripes TaxID=31033 RepID=UPI0005D19CFF|nr:probable isoprenylcysteine alpha-carbonyl methylesterase ICMEL1 [Takifugu rubripes]XP_011614114.1 probable isoprenylcysteine alpha-carbonyl methylesterase ICMEL1 [Takifugu rubripes]XP_011614115.1 probable isoprenylcysteine alpha-carbonyl methylesterase ICMEL1 [Takifugu rubripes]|eukprot:XP_011614113.1 PREDICTED: probable isoprenylcysteine alpha-carbonyl methylesterase ICMEL1 [Takifugu rubripes]